MVVRSAARPATNGETPRQVIEIIVADGYHPNLVEARAGVPIRLVFRRRDDDPCTDRVVFSQPRIARHLAPRATTIVDLPTTDGREIRFTCGMGRYRGRIELVPSRSGRFRGRSWTGLAIPALIGGGVSLGAILAIAGGAMAWAAAALAAIVVALVVAHGPLSRRRT